MAIVQISRIQHRRGLQQDFPQLASAELGWSIDQRRLFIGNGTLVEGAPTEGVTEILTENSNFLQFMSTYTFAGTDSGYTSQTGTSLLTPVTRSIQKVLDEYVSVRDFGAIGDGITDDTAAINRCIQQIYKNTLNGVQVNVQRAIKFPAGTYKVTSSILIPPNALLYGDGKNNTVISATTGSTFLTSDSLFQTGVNLSLNSAIMPESLCIRDMTLTTASTTAPVVYVDTATNVMFDYIKFSGGNYSISLNNVTSYIRTHHCVFTSYATKAFYISALSTGLVTRSNYFDTNTVQMNPGLSNITTLTSGSSGMITYQIADTLNNFRIGIIKYNFTNYGVSFDDEYSEPSGSINANVWIVPASGAITCTVTGTSTFKYNITQFIP